MYMYIYMFGQNEPLYFKILRYALSWWQGSWDYRGYCYQTHFS